MEPQSIRYDLKLGNMCMSLPSSSFGGMSQIRSSPERERERERARQKTARGGSGASALSSMPGRRRRRAIKLSSHNTVSHIGIPVTNRVHGGLSGSPSALRGTEEEGERERERERERECVHTVFPKPFVDGDSLRRGKHGVSRGSFKARGLPPTRRETTALNSTGKQNPSEHSHTRT